MKRYITGRIRFKSQACDSSRLFMVTMFTIMQVETVVSVSPKSNLSFEVLSIQIARRAGC